MDFRELVRELASEFKTRIELRQIGVRDEARLLTGYGTCGRPLCCSTWLKSFDPISIKMAKQQDLALNPSRLSGLCGRLKCCLRYELNHGGRAAARDEAYPGSVDETAGAPAGGCGGLRRGLRRMNLPRIAITVGDPAGIGPEIAAKAAVDPRVREVCEPVFYGRIRRRASRGRALSAAAGRAAYDAIVAAVDDAMAGGWTPSRPRRSTRRRSRWPACPGAATPNCWRT